jgi:Uma2 family endonuclease
MTAVLERPQLNQDEFMALQAEGPGVEFVHGRLVPLMPVDGVQGEAWGEVWTQVHLHVKARKLGTIRPDTLTYLDGKGDLRYFPDIAFLASDGAGQFDGKKFIGPPTLVVEVTSPESDKREETEKKENYFRFGVRWYWIVNTVTGCTEEYRAGADDYHLVSTTPFTAAFRPELFPGLEITISE